ncbi:MAG: hypothetical protein ACE3L7_12530 [Candidatus Pristimantibacillus sp.]
MQSVIGIQLLVPPHKSPVLKDQITQAIKERFTIIDQDSQVLFLTIDTDASSIKELIDPYGSEAVIGSWLQLDEEWEEGRMFSDYGLTTPTGNRYLDLDLAAIWTIEAIDITSEPGLAWLQADEFILAQIQADGQRLAAFDRQLEQLLEKTAAAYGCRMQYMT